MNLITRLFGRCDPGILTILFVLKFPISCFILQVCYVLGCCTSPDFLVTVPPAQYSLTFPGISVKLFITRGGSSIEHVLLLAAASNFIHGLGKNVLQQSEILALQWIFVSNILLVLSMNGCRRVEQKCHLSLLPKMTGFCPTATLHGSRTENWASSCFKAVQSGHAQSGSRQNISETHTTSNHQTEMHITSFIKKE